MVNGSIAIGSVTMRSYRNLDRCTSLLREQELPHASKSLATSPAQACPSKSRLTQLRRRADRVPHRAHRTNRSSATRMSPEALHPQRFIAVTSRQSSGPQGKLMPMGSTKHVGVDAATGQESKTLGDARADDSANTAVSYAIILGPYERVADLDERLRRIFAVLSLLPLWE
jgi:hypothetical protein